MMTPFAKTTIKNELLFSASNVNLSKINTL